jgi:hypothetical protein
VGIGKSLAEIEYHFSGIEINPDPEGYIPADCCIFIAEESGTGSASVDGNVF